MISDLDFASPWQLIFGKGSASGTPIFAHISFATFSAPSATPRTHAAPLQLAPHEPSVQARLEFRITFESRRPVLLLTDAASVRDESRRMTVAGCGEFVAESRRSNGLLS
jgi:hypothetical protein